MKESESPENSREGIIPSGNCEFSSLCVEVEVPKRHDPEFFGREYRVLLK